MGPALRAAFQTPAEGRRAHSRDQFLQAIVVTDSARFAYSVADFANRGVFKSGPTIAPHRVMLVDAPFNAITHKILSASIEVHRCLGPGLLESIYIPCLLFELAQHKLRFSTQRVIPIVYKGMQFDTSYRLDLIVEDVVVVEVKAVDAVLPVHHAQPLTYMNGQTVLPVC